MKKTFFRSALIVIIISIAGFSPQTARAISVNIPGDTPQERKAVLQIWRNNNEGAVAKYLNPDMFANTPVVKQEACKRLRDIGSSSSIQALLDIATSSAEYSKVKEEAALAIWSIKYREDIAQGNNGVDILIGVLNNDGDITKTVQVKVWAMGLLGDKGEFLIQRNTQEKVKSILRAIVNNPALTPYSDYLKKAAKDNIAKIDFIGRHQPMDSGVLEQGLSNPEHSVRKWCLNQLLKLDPPPDTLEETLNIALAANIQVVEDGEFIFYIRQALEELKAKNTNPIVIEYPEEGAVIKTPYVEIEGYTPQGSFHERKDLPLPDDTYIKTITDEQGNQVSKSIKIYYQNKPPAIGIKDGTGMVLRGDSINIIRCVGGPILTLNIYGLDPDDNDLLYFVYPYPLPAEANFYYDAHIFTFMPKQIGTYTFKFKVEDSYGLADEKTVNIIVNPPNRPPVLGLIGNKTIDAGKTLTIALSSTDPDNNPLTYSATNLPNGATFSNQTFTWTPKNKHVGTYNKVHFEVSDGTAATSEDIIITVNALPPPVIKGITPSKDVKPGQKLTISGTGFGEKGANISGVYIAKHPANITSWSDNRIEFIIPNLPRGTCAVYVQTKDKIMSNSINVTVVNEDGVKKRK